MEKKTQESPQVVPMTACPRCGVDGALSIGQSCFQGKLRWYERVDCPNCGLRSEADGVGRPPEEIRQRLIAEGGAWETRLSSLKSGAAAGKVLREALDLNMQQVSVLLKQMPGVVYAGTKAEATWVAGLLNAVGESANVERAGSPGK